MSNPEVITAVLSCGSSIFSSKQISYFLSVEMEELILNYIDYYSLSIILCNNVTYSDFYFAFSSVWICFRKLSDFFWLVSCKIDIIIMKCTSFLIIILIKRISHLPWTLKILPNSSSCTLKQCLRRIKNMLRIYC